MDLYFFDFDRTLYAYDYRMRLPALARITGTSQYHLASSWWAAGFETRAEAGEWPTSAEYLAQFEQVTGEPLTLSHWQEARALASTPIPQSVDALRLAATLGTVCVLSNNPAPFAESLSVLAPDVTAIVGENLIVSCRLGIRKPEPLAFSRALDLLGAQADNTFFVDDSPTNVAGAASIGIHAHLLDYRHGVPQVDALTEAVMRFSNRKN